MFFLQLGFKQTFGIFILAIFAISTQVMADPVEKTILCHRPDNQDFFVLIAIRTEAVTAHVELHGDDTLYHPETKCGDGFPAPINACPCDGISAGGVTWSNEFNAGFCEFVDLSNGDPTEETVCTETRELSGELRCDVEHDLLSLITDLSEDDGTPMAKCLVHSSEGESKRYPKDAFLTGKQIRYCSAQIREIARINKLKCAQIGNTIGQM